MLYNNFFYDFFIVILIFFCFFFLILFHEFGHYLFAKILNISIEEFSVGFGYNLFFWLDKNGVKYFVSVIPVGGYIKLHDNFSLYFDIFNSFNYFLFSFLKFIKYVIVILSGSFFNILFSFMLYFFVYFNGFYVYKPIVSDVSYCSVAKYSGFYSGVEINYVNNVKVNCYDSVNNEIINSIKFKKNIVFTVRDLFNNKIYDIIIDYNNIKFVNYNSINDLGFFLSNYYYELIIDNIAFNSISERFGLKKNDRIIKVCGRYVFSVFDFVNLFYNNIYNKKVSFLISRKKGESKYLSFNVDLIFDKFFFNFCKIDDFFNFIGISFKKRFLFSKKYMYFCKFNFLSSIINSFNEIKVSLLLILYLFFDFFNGNINVFNLFFSPIDIFFISFKLMKLSFIYFIIFLSYLSINIFAINLLFPFPIFDCGQLLLFIINKFFFNFFDILIFKNFFYYFSFLFIIIFLLIVFC